ncbi:2'-deoxycytidine 5'-triphosphate deaminase [Candidatus Liberibacter africanus]|uniref:2'-deoxycytidine 5'-triphosphate deaminase n=1 Tax=Candidatus Liberibacter africanus PTSAPSY TaxID=1277257 RepID=A0A0G3I2Q6_LIBAF|nr:2'-deoxycytidine 5'-triphosphate deaminase [Candidatus Liberibacter africanus]AKK20174.1 2'-deoxycytidine 5'-triphosphate deaminase [Candidatus Liberibacter africanus PTSAPSY]
MEKGVLPDKAIAALIESGNILSDCPVDKDQIQPASLDLRLSSKAYRVSASFLPNGEDLVLDKIERFKLHEIDLSRGAVLEANCVYIVPLMERLDLKKGIFAYANPKSSIGRIDVFARLIVDRCQKFDRIPANYNGPLYLEISPSSFPVFVRAGSRLSQIRLVDEQRFCSSKELREIHKDTPLVRGGLLNFSEEGIALSIDLKGEKDGKGVVGYKSKRHTTRIDIDSQKKYEIRDFWDPLYAENGSSLVLDPNEFYIFASREFLQIPPFLAAEMSPYDPLIGEFRVHYAGFFDPGFGYSLQKDTGTGAKAVLEVRSYLPFVLEHGQIIGRLKYERMMEEPENIYGVERGSNYQLQGLKLSKHFQDI